jgi:uncharacterized cupin superfamily protein
VSRGFQSRAPVDCLPRIFTVYTSITFHLLKMVDRSHALRATDIAESVVFSTAEDILSSRGVWLCEPGLFDIDTELEFFTIVEGSASVAFPDGCVLELDAGTTGYFKGGERTVWTVRSPLIKTYQNLCAGSDDASCLRNSVWRANAVPLEDEPMEPHKSWIAEGSPDVSSTIAATFADKRILCGIWRCTPGSVTYVEEDEIFTVVEGRATVTIENGTTLNLFPGIVGEFKKGDIATFQVHETFLKTFQITLSAAAA